MAAAFVRENKHAGMNLVAGVSSYTVPIAVGADAGNTVVAVFVLQCTAVIIGPTLTDSKGNTWTVDEATLNGAYLTVLVFSTHQDAGTLTASDTLTVSVSGGTFDTGMFWVEELSGILTASSPRDQTASHGGSGTSGATGTTAATTQAAEVAIAVMGLNVNEAIAKDAAYTAFPSGSDGIANTHSGNEVAAFPTYEILNTTGTQSATYTFGAASYRACIVTYKAAAIVGAAAQQTTFGSTAAGVRTAIGAAAQSITDTFTAAGVRTAVAAAALPVDVVIASSGVRTANGSATLPIAFDITVSGSAALYPAGTAGAVLGRPTTGRLARPAAGRLAKARHG